MNYLAQFDGAHEYSSKSQFIEEFLKPYFAQHSILDEITLDTFSFDGVADDVLVWDEKKGLYTWPGTKYDRSADFANIVACNAYTALAFRAHLEELNPEKVGSGEWGWIWDEVASEVTSRWVETVKNPASDALEALQQEYLVLPDPKRAGIYHAFKRED